MNDMVEAFEAEDLRTVDVGFEEPRDPEAEAIGTAPAEISFYQDEAQDGPVIW